MTLLFQSSEPKPASPYATPPSTPTVTRRVSCFTLLQKACSDNPLLQQKECELHQDLQGDYLRRRNSDASVRSNTVHDAEPSHAELQRRLMANW